MAHEEKRSWIMLVVAVGAYASYVITILGRANGRPLPDVAYASTLLWTIGAAIAAAIVLEIVIAIVAGIVGGTRGARETHRKDVRDKEIGRFGEYTGQSFVVIGAVAAMLMAMAEWDFFWIANVIYLCFVLSAILGSLTKIAAYRQGLPKW